MDKIKNKSFGLIGLILIFSTLFNIRNQYLTHKDDEKKNNDKYKKRNA